MFIATLPKVASLSLKIVFAGTPHFALPSLQAIAMSKHPLLAVYSQPDRPAGRGHKLQPSPVKQWALDHDVPVYQPLNFKSQEALDILRALAPDLMVVIAYGLILPQAVLDIPKYGCVNVHASLLPRWRGASPIQQALLHHDASTGITIMQLDQGMDTGDILSMVRCPIESADTAERLHDKLAQLSSAPLLEVIESIANQTVMPRPQDNQHVTYAPKINKSDAAILWQRSATEIDCQVRAFYPWPIAFTHLGNETIRIHQSRVLNQTVMATPGTIIAIDKQGISVATGHQALIIEKIQFASGKVLNVSDWLNAHQKPLQIGLVFQ
jgi:methionyl-tRNA formyltransferase